MVNRRYGIYKSALHIGDVREGEIHGIDLFTGEFTGIGQQSITGVIGFDVSDELKKICNIEHLLEKETEINGYEKSSWIDGSDIFKKKEGTAVDIVVKNGRCIALVQPSREHTVVVAEDGYEHFTPLVYWTDMRYDKAIQKPFTIMIPSQDALLATDIYLPEGTGPFPVILIRTPYNKQTKALEDLRFVKMGYALCVQDVRGKFESSGRWKPMTDEIVDGKATISYIETQPWCDGNIGMIGASYGGYTGWCAAASGCNGLKALVSIVTAGGAFSDLPYRGGMLLSGILPWALAVNKKGVRAEKLKHDDWQTVFDHRPLCTLATQCLGEEIDYFNEWLSHPTFDEYWKRGDWTRSCLQKVSALIVSGQFDDDIYGSMQAIDKSVNEDMEYRKIIGPWGHNVNTTRTLNGFYMGADSLLYDLDLKYVRWFDMHLRQKRDMPKSDAVYDWRAHGWVLDSGEISKKVLFLAPDALTDEITAQSECEYVSDPKNPAPSLINPSENELNMPADYSLLQERCDVLHFKAEPFLHDTCLQGAPFVQLFWSSDCPDTDIIARLCLKTEDGKLLKLCETQRRAALSDDYTELVPLVQDEVRKYTLSFHEICVTVKKGETLTLQICSAAKNLFFVNHNTANDRSSDMEYRIARNTVHTGEKTSSSITVFLRK